MQFPLIFNSKNAIHDANSLEQMLDRGGNNFNFLRLILAALVLFSHSFSLIDGDRSREPLSILFQTLSFGELAVDGFFLLSGFLIVRSWMQNPAIWPYLMKRILRIYPGFIAAFLLSVVVAGSLGASAPDYLRQLKILPVIAFALSLQEPKFGSVFQGQPFAALNGSMWTIAYEFRCYILVLALGLLGAIRNKSVWVVATVLLMAIYPFRPETGEFGFRGAFYLLGFPGPSIRLTMLFMAGGCFYLFLERIRFSSKTALLFLPLLCMAMFSSHVADLAIATLGAYILFWLAFLKIPILDRFKHHADVSYGLYLYGWPVQKLLLWFFPIASPWLLFPLALVLSYACGYISWICIEKPALRWKRRTPRDPRVLSA